MNISYTITNNPNPEPEPRHDPDPIPDMIRRPNNCSGSIASTRCNGTKKPPAHERWRHFPNNFSVIRLRIWRLLQV